MSDATPYPAGSAERNRWVLARRTPRRELDPWRPYAFLSEQEPDEARQIAQVSTLFLTNSECPWKCVFCDLWRNTLEAPTPIGAVPAQIDHALKQLPPARHIKLYNSGSFFDPRAIPPADDEPIANRVKGFDRVIVESHPALVGERCLQFRDLLAGRLEVAMGLETAHPEALAKLNKRITPDDFASAAAFLVGAKISVRAFILVGPPFVPTGERADWVRRSVDFAYDCGAAVVSLIPTRMGNGALASLQETGDFVPPTLSELESSIEYALSRDRGRAFADLWDLERFARCQVCFEPRRDRLARMNLSQTILPRPVCAACAGWS